LAFRGLFIGIDRYQSPDIDELSCARRDAVALEALFVDTLGGATVADALVDGRPVAGRSPAPDHALPAALTACADARVAVAQPDAKIVRRLLRRFARGRAPRELPAAPCASLSFHEILSPFPPRRDGARRARRLRAPRRSQGAGERDRRHAAIGSIAGVLRRGAGLGRGPCRRLCALWRRGDRVRSSVAPSSNRKPTPRARRRRR
jgi:hypothetical protein